MVVIGYIHETFYLVAGQHRLKALTVAAVPVLMTVSLREYESMDELKADYAITNTGKALTRVQALRALDAAASLGIDQNLMRCASAAILLIANDFTGDVRAAAELADPNTLKSTMDAWATPICAYCNCIKAAYRAEMHWYLRSPVMAVGVVTYRYNPEQAQAFWESTVANDALSARSPQAHLHRYISVTGVSAKGAGEYARVVASLWNAFVDRRELSRVGGKTSDHIVIKGSPFREIDIRNKQKGVGLTILGLAK